MYYREAKERRFVNGAEQWRTEGGGLGCSNPPRNSEDIGGVLDRTCKKNRRLNFLL